MRMGDKRLDLPSARLSRVRYLARLIVFSLCSVSIPACSSPPGEHLAKDQHDTLGCGLCGGFQEAITLASGLSEPAMVAVDALNVYWGEASGNVMSIPTGGGTPTTLATGQGDVGGLAPLYDSLSPTIVYPDPTRPDFTLSASSLVFWAGTAVEGMEVLPKVGTPFDVGPVPEQNDPYAVAVDWVNVYWTYYPRHSGHGAVMMAPLRGGSPVTLSSGGLPTGIAVDATSVYWGDEDLGVMKKPIAGGPAVTLASGYSAVALALDSIPVAGGNAANVYWTDAAGSVMTVPVSGGTPVTLASGQGWPAAIAVDSTAVYWVDFTDGTVEKLPFGQEIPTALASNQDAPCGIAVDSTSVYWTNYDGGTLMKTAK
jgi:hypothetical protein